MTTSSSPGECGKRLLPVIIDQLAQEDPNRPWASIPRDDYDLSQGYADISYAALANAINKLAWMVEKSIGRSNSFETIAYLGTPDIRYHLVSPSGLVRAQGILRVPGKSTLTNGDRCKWQYVKLATKYSTHLNSTAWLSTCPSWKRPIANTCSQPSGSTSQISSMIDPWKHS